MGNESATAELEYFVFFLDESQLAALPKNPELQQVDLLESCSAKPEFDMRQLHSYSLLDPNAKLAVSPE